jgi:ring-1,2-phenylacetyl-CoA epoxidase subunit PaaC
MHDKYILQLADNALILSQRLSEWCGHGPVLEQDIAITNIALDLLGQARNLLAHAASLENNARTEDEMAFFRDTHQFNNVLLVEYPNTDWAFTITRQFFFDVFNYYNYQALLESADTQLAGIAEKSLKEVTYHLRYSSEWMVRLGDGTEVSHQKMQAAVDTLWPYTGEMMSPNTADDWAQEAGIGPDLALIKQAWETKVKAVLEEATLTLPSNTWMQKGGKNGIHSEHFGFLLAEMQHVQRTYPGQNW